LSSFTPYPEEAIPGTRTEMELKDAAWSAAADCHNFQVLPVLPGRVLPAAFPCDHPCDRAPLQASHGYPCCGPASLVFS
jgi:hypothetical protein